MTQKAIQTMAGQAPDKVVQAADIGKNACLRLAAIINQVLLPMLPNAKRIESPANLGMCVNAASENVYDP